MNKQDVIKKIREIYAVDTTTNHVINLINQIDEPQKVVIPKFVADKIKYCKNTSDYGLFHAMDHCFQYKESAEWLEDNQETFTRAWLFGYEVEQEKLYTVEIPDPKNPYGYNHLHRYNDSGLYIYRSVNPNWNLQECNQFTEAEIKKDFEWAWKWAEEVE